MCGSVLPESISWSNLILCLFFQFNRRYFSMLHLVQKMLCPSHGIFKYSGWAVYGAELLRALLPGSFLQSSLLEGLLPTQLSCPSPRSWCCPAPSSFPSSTSSESSINAFSHHIRDLPTAQFPVQCEPPWTLSSVLMQNLTPEVLRRSDRECSWMARGGQGSDFNAQHSFQ